MCDILKSKGSGYLSKAAVNGAVKVDKAEMGWLGCMH